MKGVYRCISGHEVEEDRRPADLYRWGVCPKCISPRTFNRFVREGTMDSYNDLLAIVRKQRLMDKMDFDATAARMDRENEALCMRISDLVRINTSKDEKLDAMDRQARAQQLAIRDLNKANGDYAGRCFFYIQDAKRDANRIARQGRVNTDLRDENVKLRATLGLRNGTIQLMKCQAKQMRVAMEARRGQYDRQTNRLAKVGITMDESNREASVQRARTKRAEDSLRLIGILSQPGSTRDMYTDLMECHRIATKGN